VGARQTQRLSVRSLLQRAGLSGLYGGIQVEAAGGAGQLDTTHLIFDELGGFGAMMKMFGHDPATTLGSRSFGGTKEWTTRAPMLALSSPDPALGLPAGTILQPKVFVRNTSTKTYTAHIRFNWRSATAAGKTAPIDLLLKPNATQAVDVAALQAQKLIPADAHWAAVVLSAPIQPDELLAVAASYDQSGRYGAQTPFSDQLAFHWEGGMWQVDSTHNSLITATNGGSQTVQAELTVLYNHGSSQYKVGQALAPDEQMLVDLGKLIRNQVPDKDGHTLPPDLTSGAYRLRDLTDTAVGNLYEGKVIVDKTYGHAAYGCGICCGYVDALMGYDPLGVAVASSSAQQVYVEESCGGGTVLLTEDFPTWSTGNTAIATANKNTISGVAAGTTTDSAKSITLNLGAKGVVDGNPCPTGQFQPSGTTNVAPKITSFDPNPIMIGVSKTTLTINGSGFGTDPTVHLPSGITSTGQGSTDTQIVLQGVSVALSTTVSNDNVTVTAGSQTSAPAALTVDGPYHMIVQSDVTGLCSGCITAVRRIVTYQIQNFSGSNAGTTSVGETGGFGASSCSPNTLPSPTTCSSNFSTLSNGTFSDVWSMNSDAYAPPGCGFTVNDHWQWCPHSPAQTLGTLTGYIHTNAILINGVLSPAKMAPGTVVPF
jgi:hypothetical protein